ncbi:alpha-2 adrenergic receptor [Aplysia californica]|uniref:Alpha-2 adrenergic receptor n=1 Tax=Aplysia californica TaxID=6500 RepID=A0ABM0JJ52_APLCA|nr:alpha-2 adrenergic receptor [Aplysia californica]
MADIGVVDEVDIDLDGVNDSQIVFYVGYDFDEYAGKVTPKPENKSPMLLVLNTTREPMPDIYELNRRKAGSFYPIFIILGCIMVLGVLCNILVCYIYRCRSRRATSNFFVIFFAIFDMFGCFIGIPLEMCALGLPYVFDVVPLCKIMGFLETWSVCALCLTLICVSYDCYRKHCRPSEDFGVKKARVYCIVSIVVAVVVSIPACFVFDINKIRTAHAGIYGEGCSIDPDLPQWLRILYFACVLTTFTMSLIIMSVLYCLIGVNYWKQRQAEERGEKPSPAKREFPKKHRFVREDTSTSSVTNYNEEICRLHSQSTVSHSNTDPARVPLKSSGIVKTNSLQASSAPPSAAVVQLHVKHTRQTWIFLVISIAFVVTMLPYVVVTILCVATKVFNQFSSNATEIAFNLCIRSYLLNYVVKPVVYIIFNLNFRKEVKQLFLKVWALCTRTSMEQQQGSRQLRRSFTMGAPRSTSRIPIYRPPVSSA